MKVIAKLNYLHIAPRKVRLVADLIRGKKVTESQRILDFTTKRASLPLKKLLNSAIANAKNNFQLEADNLKIAKLLVNEGPKLKRWRPRARGQAYEIQKKTSHITLVLEEIKPSKRFKKGVKAEIKEKKEERRKTKIPKEKKFGGKEKSKRPLFKKGVQKFFRRKAF